MPVHSTVTDGLQPKVSARAVMRIDEANLRDASTKVRFSRVARSQIMCRA